MDMRGGLLNVLWIFQEGIARMAIAKSIILFIVAGLAEIGGGYLFWQWVRNNRSIYWGLLGAALLILYGLIPPFQPTHFGRAYAAYGGVFIVLSLLWGYLIDHIQPDRYDIVGAGICLVGVIVIMYFPR